MAGAYGTAGETARRGVNIWPDTGGGWLNGRGDDTMVMLKGYGHMVDFFASFDWWKTEPHDELVNNANYCLAELGKTYALYLPHGGNVTVRIGVGSFTGAGFDPRPSPNALPYPLSAARSGPRLPCRAVATGHSCWRGNRLVGLS